MDKIVSTAVGTELHLAYLTESGDIKHRVRRADGAWSGWGTIAGGEFISLTCAGVGCELHVLVVTTSDVWYHTVRFPDGSWQPFVQLPDQPLLEP